MEALLMKEGMSMLMGGGGGGGGFMPQIDHQQVAQQAQQDGADGSMVSKALSFVSGHSDQHTAPIDHEQVTSAHQQAYQQGGAADLDAGSMGSAAAMQAFKMFTQSGGAGGQNQLVSMAMSEASSLFEGSGSGSGNDKQEVLQSAGMMVMKMMVQSKMSSMMGGGNSGGLSGLMGMASNFL